MRIKIRIFLTFALLIFAGCEASQSGENDQDHQNIPVQSININKLSTSIEINKYEQLYANITPSNATNKTVTWKSDDNSIAEVSSTGMVYAKSAGTTNITATTKDGNIPATCTVTVYNTAVAVSGISLTESSITINMGSTHQLYATIQPLNATNQSLSWSSNSSIIEVSSSGVITPVSVGTAKVTVTSFDGHFTDDCQVTVEARVTGVEISKSSTEINAGYTEQLSASVLPSNATNNTVSWSSSDESKATVSQTGLVRGVSEGSATITVTTAEGSFSDSCEVTISVLHVNVSGVSLNKSRTCLNVGLAEQLVATISPADATNRNLTWSSSNESVATVSQSGLVTAAALGKTIIRVTAAEGGFYAECEVSVKPPFISTWKTNNSGTNTTANNRIKLPLDENGIYNFTVEWGDGSTDTITSFNQTETLHTYVTAGTYDLTIKGTCEGFGFRKYTNDNPKLIDVKSWGQVKLHNKGAQFDTCLNLTAFSATDAPDLSNITDMWCMFYDARLFNDDISNWDVSTVTNMSRMFSDAYKFNQDLSSWNVGNVTDMSEMFYNADSFNKNLDSWDVSKVTNMKGMFRDANVFNGEIGSWNVGNVTDMSYMFDHASSFNRNISGWDVSRVDTMQSMFYYAIVFNCNLNSWDVGNVTNMENMFYLAYAFNGDVSGWNVSSVTTMKYMFFNATSFNCSLNAWDVSNVKNMQGMFSSAKVFNGNISSWNVGNVEQMAEMFDYATVFNGNISSWNVSKVINMRAMFRAAKAFNQSLGLWDVSSVTNMENMFQGATSFNQDINSWDVSMVTRMEAMFSGATKFNQPLDSWDVRSVTDMEYMFTDAAAFNQDITGWDVTNVIYMTDMFARSGLALAGNIPAWYH